MRAIDCQCLDPTRSGAQVHVSTPAGESSGPTKVVGSRVESVHADSSGTFYSMPEHIQMLCDASRHPAVDATTESTDVSPKCLEALTHLETKKVRACVGP